MNNLTFSAPVMTLDRRDMQKHTAGLFNQKKKWCFSQSISQSANQSINQSINQSVNQSITQSVSQSVTQSVNQSVNQLIKTLFIHIVPKIKELNEIDQNANVYAKEKKNRVQTYFQHFM